MRHVRAAMKSRARPLVVRRLDIMVNGVNDDWSDNGGLGMLLQSGLHDCGVSWTEDTGVGARVVQLEIGHGT
jgi:hypothetical protein